jgi:hypothetical protein
LEPIDGESLLGFIARLVVLNHHDEMSALLLVPYWLETVSAVPPKGLIAELSQAAQVPEEILEAMSYRRDNGKLLFMGHRLNDGWLSIRPRRACPLCLAENCYHRQIWDIQMYTACVEHGCRLIRGCPGCGKLLRWASAHLDQCNCGSHLNDPSVAVPAEQWEINDSEIIAGLFDGSLPVWRGEVVVDVLHAVRTMQAARRRRKQEEELRIRKAGGAL